MKRNNIGQTYVWIFVIIVILGLGKLILFGNEKSQASDNELNEIAINLNLKAPNMLDSFTRFDSARALPGNKFQYNLTLMDLKEAVDTLLIQTEGKKQCIKSLKAGYGFAYFKTYNVEIINCYYDSIGDYICKYNILPNEYK